MPLSKVRAHMGASELARSWLFIVFITSLRAHARATPSRVKGGHMNSGAPSSSYPLRQERKRSCRRVTKKTCFIVIQHIFWIAH